MDLTPERILDIFKRTPDRPVSVREIMEHLEAPHGARKLIFHALAALVHEGRLVKLRNRFFALPRHATRVTGTIHVSTRGAGYILGAGPDGGDLFVHQRNVGDALDGDRVEAEILVGAKGPEGHVCAVLKRTHEHIVGQFRRTGRGGMVTPRNLRIGRWVELREAPPARELPDGTWVRVRVTRWSSDAETPLLAEFEENLGLPGQRGLPVLLLLRDQGVEIEFPPEVVTQAAHYHKAVTEAERHHRTDLTNETIFTIDPATAKDFDDAISIQRLDNGGWSLGVHIADVAHFVTPGSPLDQEARRRATSIYPVDRVVSMLPERLSNDLCSLRPREDRLALSCIMELSSQCEVIRHEIHNAVIHSRHRLNYAEVQKFFERPDDREGLAFADIADDLLLARELGRRLYEKRIDRGALDLDLPETEIVCNPEGDTIGLQRHERYESHRLIEEFMLLANETVARHLKKSKLPCLYRVHDIPDPKALEKVAPALAVFGVKAPRQVAPTPKAYQPLVEALRGRDGAHIAQRMLLRTLMRAIYTPDNRGHFGLASKCYCHFTSPIRRYPDLIVHRILKAQMAGETEQPEWLAQFEEGMDETARHCNERAESAEALERDATQIKAMEFMADHLGDIFEGWVSGIARRGFFVEIIELPVEGFVPLSTITDDHYDPDDDQVRMIGRYTHRTFRLGQRVRVQIIRINPIEGEMELMLAEETAKTGKHTRDAGRKAPAPHRGKHRGRR